MRLLFLTGSRGEWGYIRPILRLCRDRTEIEYAICATNMHLLPAYGLSVDEIRADGFDVTDEIYMALEGDTHHAMAKSLGLFLVSFVDVLKRFQPDWLILAGDRGEQLMGSIAGAYTYVPSAHIQAGELSGNIDGVSRHAIGKFAHLHFAANEDAASRLRNLGEEEFRIHVVGAPQLDDLVQRNFTPREQLYERFNIDLSKPYLLVVQHPVTEEYHLARDQVAELSRALKSFEMPKVWVLPNNDAGSHIIRQGIFQYKHGEIYTFNNLNREDYLGFLGQAACIVGNSSSAILEAPTFKVPAVNLGRRQQHRLQGKNVLNAPYVSSEIMQAVEQACSEAFRKGLDDCVNPYGDGHSSERILRILLETPRDAKLLTKHLTY